MTAGLRLQRLRRDHSGTTVIEFGLLAPVFLLAILGSLEIGHTFYVNVTLQGQMQKAARDMTLEGASVEAQRLAIEQLVRDRVRTLKSDADVDFTSVAYHDYRSARDRAEEFADTPAPSPWHDGICNHGEAFVDYNHNGRRDLDSGVDGRGGAKDVVMLTADVTYPRLALGRLFGMGEDVHLTAKTLLRNQPSSNQQEPVQGNCA